MSILFHERIPIYLNLTLKKILVVGGGAAATEKIKGLSASGCFLCVISPLLSRETRELLQGWPHANLKVEERKFENDDLLGSWLVYAATDNSILNKNICQYCETLGIWSNSVDDAAHAHFYSCAQVRQGPWRFAVATDGKFAGFSKLLREVLENTLPDSDSDDLAEIALFRNKLREKLPDPDQRRNVLKNIIQQLKTEYFADCKELNQNSQRSSNTIVSKWGVPGNISKG